MMTDTGRLAADIREETVIDISINAGALIAKKRIRITDSRELVAMIGMWATEFDERFKVGKFGDDYIDAVDRFAAEKLTKAYGRNL